ncbi:MAG: NADH-quinone oxidoreductase subunit C [Anaerolineales bacterium]|nr:NADH-quinone oxidoreductase subunit C [Anaerolineales bacterium]
MNLQELRQALRADGTPIEKIDGIWWHIPGLDVRLMAQTLLQSEARLITITARPADAGECRLIYHWDCQGEMWHLSTLTQGGKIDSIAAICPAADWIECEIHDLYAVVFSGRETPPLVLRADDPSGLFLSNGKLSQEGKK